MKLFIVALLLISVSSDSVDDNVYNCENDLDCGLNNQHQSDSFLDQIFNIKTDVSKVSAIFSISMFKSFTYSLNNMSDITKNEEFKSDRPTAIYIHGWHQNGDKDIASMAIRSAYRDRGDENIITIDWKEYAQISLKHIFYKTAIIHLKNICIELAKQLEKIRKNDFKGYKSIYLIGHSLGGQCAGLVGRTLKNISEDQFELSRIYALDPARPAFEANDFPLINVHIPTKLYSLGAKGFDCLSKNDAKYVQIIHTNGGELGMLESQGHADFFPNLGSTQRGCKNAKTEITCHHQRSWIYFQESVRNHKSLIGVKCNSSKDFNDSKCDINDVAIMGYSNESLPIGNYYLITHPNIFHTGMGINGIKAWNNADIKYDTKVTARRSNPETTTARVNHKKNNHDFFLINKNY